ncbi:hypothetical protein SO802_000122 [Lithocarpus litseifolius]|uniref:Bulb-type lectin domain-containing protein n=1 Tax=Lithocarpus litseifolius TaxID=425828 RepID=A0AAW2DR41_9ROSI
MENPARRIYKVPYHLRKWNEEAYTPRVISIGPIHHGNNKFQTMERYKVRCFQSLQQRTSITLENFERDIRQVENSVRQCYVDTVVDLGSDDFVTMIKLDASFILELFFKFNSESWPIEDPLLVEAWLLNTVFRDLTFRLPESSELPNRGLNTTFPKYSATQLHEAGIKFTKAPTTRVLDLDFKNGELKIPALTFVDDTEDLVRNIMALEQCNIRLDAYFTDFYIILDHLISTTKDVDLLSKKGIIVNCLGDSETVTSMINKLNRGIITRGAGKVGIPTANDSDMLTFVFNEVYSNGSTKQVLWQSFDHLRYKLLPGMKLGVNHKTGQTWSLTSGLTKDNYLSWSLSDEG